MVMLQRHWRRWTSWLWVALAAGGAAGAGAVAGLTGAHREASADLAPGNHQSKYTYGSPDCAVESRKDPINLVFTGLAGLSQFVGQHAARGDHGGWGDHSGGQQYFIDHYGDCQPTDGQSASGTLNRYHMRYNQGDVGGTLDFDRSLYGGGYYTLAAAHWEEFKAITECFPFNHAVLGNEEDPGGLGGFNLAREAVWALWVTQASDGYSVVADAQSDGDWGNIQRFRQCDGDYAWSDGEVLYISMPGGGGGGGGGCAGRGFCSWL